MNYNYDKISTRCRKKPIGIISRNKDSYVEVVCTLWSLTAVQFQSLTQHPGAHSTCYCYSLIFTVCIWSSGSGAITYLYSHALCAAYIIDFKFNNAFTSGI